MDLLFIALGILLVWYVVDSYVHHGTRFSPFRCGPALKASHYSVYSSYSFYSPYKAYSSYKGL